MGCQLFYETKKCAGFLHHHFDSPHFLCNLYSIYTIHVHCNLHVITHDLRLELILHQILPFSSTCSYKHSLAGTSC